MPAGVVPPCSESTSSSLARTQSASFAPFRGRLASRPARTFLFQRSHASIARGLSVPTEVCDESRLNPIARRNPLSVSVEAGWPMIAAPCHPSVPPSPSPTLSPARERNPEENGSTRSEPGDRYLGRRERDGRPTRSAQTTRHQWQIGSASASHATTFGTNLAGDHATSLMDTATPHDACSCRLQQGPPFIAGDSAIGSSRIRARRDVEFRGASARPATSLRDIARAP